MTDLDLAELLEAAAADVECPPVKILKRSVSLDWDTVVSRTVEILKQDRAESLKRNPAIPSVGEEWRPYRALSEALRHSGPPLSASRRRGLRALVDQLMGHFDPAFIAIKGAMSMNPGERALAIEQMVTLFKLRHPQLKMGLHLASASVRTPQRIRLGARWVKKGGRLAPVTGGGVAREGGSVATCVPLDVLDVPQLGRFLRTRAYAELPAHPRRSTRKDGEDSRTVPTDVEPPSAVDLVGARTAPEHAWVGWPIPEQGLSLTDWIREHGVALRPWAAGEVFDEENWRVPPTDPEGIAVLGAVSFDADVRARAIDQLALLWGPYLGMKAALYLVRAERSARQRQRIRLGANWEKNGHIEVTEGSTHFLTVYDCGPVATFVPIRDLSVAQLGRWLRAKAHAELPSHPGRLTRKDGPPRRELPAEVERLSAPIPPDLTLAEREVSDALVLLATVASPRELAVLRLRLEGHSTAEAARRLGIRPSTGRVLLHRLRGRRLPPGAREIVSRV